MKYKYTSIYLLILLLVLSFGWYKSQEYYNQKIKILTKEKNLWYDNYRMMQETRHMEFYEDKYVEMDIKRSMKYITKSWEG